MTTYPGLPGPDVGDHVTRAETRQRFPKGVEFSIGRICMVGNTGTYVDVPFHYYEDGDDLGLTVLARLAELDAVVVEHSQGRALGADAFEHVEVAGRAVLIRTGWSASFGTEQYAVDAPFLAADGVRALVERGAAMVGIDSVNIDDMGDMHRPAHCGLLGAGIPIVEHLRGLEALPQSGFRFTAAPPMVHGMGTFPVRAYARLG